jgi:hypothetical protein
MEAIKTQPLFSLVKPALLMMGKSTEFMTSAAFFILEKICCSLSLLLKTWVSRGVIRSDSFNAAHSSCNSIKRLT